MYNRRGGRGVLEYFRERLKGGERIFSIGGGGVIRGVGYGYG